MTYAEFDAALRAAAARGDIGEMSRLYSQRNARLRAEALASGLPAEHFAEAGRAAVARRDRAAYNDLCVQYRAVATAHSPTRESVDSDPLPRSHVRATANE